MTSTDLETSAADRRAALARQYSDPPATVSARMPEIRLSVHMSKKDIPKGHFFIVDRNVGQDENPIITDIGPEFQCVVLRSSKKLSAYDSNEGQSLAESTEFSDFQHDPIFVINNAGDRPCIDTVATYSEIKKMKTPLTKEEIKAGKQLHPLYPVLKDLRLQYLSYVLYTPPATPENPSPLPGIYLFKLGARGFLGIDKSGDTCKYGEEAPTSFIKAQSICHKQYPRTTHMHTWRVFSTEFNSKEDNGDSFVDHYPSFEITGEWPDSWLETVEQGRSMLEQYLLMQYGRRLGFAWNNTSDRDFIPPHIAAKLDSPTGQEQIAAALLGKNRLSEAVNSQLVVGGAPGGALPAPRTEGAATGGVSSPRTKRGLEAQVDDAAAEFGAVETPPKAKAKATAPSPEPDEAPAPKRSGFKDLFGGKKKPTEIERAPEEAAESAKKNTEAMMGSPMQHDDPKAPGYVPKEWSDEQIGEDQAKVAKPKRIKEIAPGW